MTICVIIYIGILFSLSILLHHSAPLAVLEILVLYI